MSKKGTLRTTTAAFSLWRQAQFLALLATEVVVVEKVSVERGLYDAARPRQPLVATMLCKIAPDPVKDVQESVHTETNDIMRGDILNFAGLA